MKASRGTAFRPGTLLVVGLVLLGVAAAVLAIGYQRVQTRRCLEFYGPVAARQITKAPRVELWSLEPSGAAGRLLAVACRDISAAPGIVHLRRGLVEDAGFRWDQAGSAGRLPADTWEHAIVFSDPAGPAAQAVVVFGIDPHGGWLTVVGQPGRVRLGRLGAGLAVWLADAEKEARQP